MLPVCNYWATLGKCDRRGTCPFSHPPEAKGTRSEEAPPTSEASIAVPAITVSAADGFFLPKPAPIPGEPPRSGTDGDTTLRAAAGETLRHAAVCLASSSEEQRKQRNVSWSKVQTWEYQCPGETAPRSVREARPGGPEGSALPAIHPSTFDMKQLCARIFAGDLRAHVYGQDRSHPIKVYWAAGGCVYVVNNRGHRRGRASSLLEHHLHHAGHLRGRGRDPREVLY